MPTDPIQRNHNLDNTSSISSVNLSSQPLPVYPPARPEHPIPVVRQPVNTRYRVQSRLQAERKVDDYLRLLIKITQKSPFALQIKSDYDAFIAHLREYTGPAAGKPPAMTQDGIRKLLEDLEKVYNYSYQILQLEKKRKKPSQTQSVHLQVMRDINHALEKDFRTLRSLQPDGKMTLPELVRASKGRTIRMAPDLKMNEIQKVGCAVSSRMLLSVKDGVGREQKGVFTKAYGLDYGYVTETFGKFKAELEEILKSQIAEGKPDQTLVDFMRFYDLVEHKRQEAEEADHRAYSVGEFFVMAFDRKKDKDGRIYLAPNGNIQDIVAAFSNNMYYMPFFDDIKDALTRAKAQQALYQKRHGLKKGDNIDCRNSAMTDVAELLGHGELIARSTPMSMKLPDGTKVKGTFMDFAEGTDIDHAKLNDPYFFSKPEDYTNTRALKSVADLQILDFICGNSDRHAGNMLYQFDENGKFKGVKGIDNDLSFGTLKYDGIFGTDAYLGGVDDIRIISRDMAERVKKLSPAALSMALRSHGLRDEEVDSAVKRLNCLKDRIDQKPDPRFKHGLMIVEDDKWGSVSLEELTKGAANERSMFSLLRKVSNKQADFLEVNARRIQRSNPLRNQSNAEANVDLSRLAKRMELLQAAFSRVDVDKLDEERKDALRWIQNRIKNYYNQFRSPEANARQTLRYTKAKAEKKRADKQEEINKLRQTKNPTKEERTRLGTLEESLAGLEKAMESPDKNGEVTVKETESEFRQRQKELATRNMSALKELAKSYIDLYTKPKPKEETTQQKDEEQEKEKEEEQKKLSPKEQLEEDAMTLVRGIESVAKTGFQEAKQSFRFTEGTEMWEKTEDYSSLARKMGSFVTKLELAEQNVHFGSREYDNMKTYATFVRDELSKMVAVPLPKEQKAAAALQSFRFERTQSMMNMMRALSGMYLNYRDNKNGASLQSKTEKRILAATELYAFAKNNCEKFDVPSADDLYRRGLEQARNDAFARMKPKEIGTYIKNTVRMANEHRDNPLFVNEAQNELARYMRLTGNQPAQQLGLNGGDLRALKAFDEEHSLKLPMPKPAERANPVVK